MALETVALVVGPDWELVSAANTTAFSYRQMSHVRVMLYVGDAAPAADLQLAPAEKRSAYGPLGSAKLYARAIGGLAPLECTREVSASNPAIPVLKPLTLSALTVQAGSDIATTVAALQNRTDGSTIAVRFKPLRSSAGVISNPSPQSQWPPTAGPVRATFVETHPKAPNSGLETVLDLTLTPRAPTNAIFNNQGGYVRNASGGYVLTGAA